ncbi:MAG: gamma carbonic anhydrase family protein [Candidatus Cloacimonetes bacterium]|nr:gamma carbonic anhydrase family protein [Candidatus Cloacimonadota bacterium]
MLLKYKDIRPKIGNNVMIAEGAKVIGDVELGELCSVWFNAVIRADVNYIKIGARTNIQDNSVLHVTTDIAPMNIGEDVTIGHSAVLHGCTIENNCLIGSNAVIWDNAEIGEGSIVGAGAVIPAETKIPPRSLVVGVPGKIKGEISDKQFKEIKKSAENYVKYGQSYI